MQVSEPFVKKISSRKFFYLLLKVIVFLISINVILFILWEKKEWWQYFVTSYYNRKGLFVLILLLVLMLANISVEALKWYFLVKENTAIKFIKALKAVFSGITAGLITPHGVGDYLGRILFLDPDKRMENISSVFFSRIAQLCITCITGFAAFLYLILFMPYDVRMFISIALSMVVLLIILLLWNKRNKILDVMSHIPFIKNVERWFNHIRKYTNQLFLKTLLLSALRYGIFLSQFVILLVFFEVHISLDILVVGAIFTFFIKSIVPTFFDLGVRELVAVFFFSAYAHSEESILAASLSLWFINVLIPALIGLVCMFQIEYVKK